MSRWFMVGLAALLLQATPAAAQYIGLFLDPNAATCAAQVGPAPWIDLHAIAVLGDAAADLTGVQFKVTGVPDTWTPQSVLWVPDPSSAISIGHPLFATPAHPWTAGVNVAFRTCMGGPGVVRVPLGRIILLGAPTPVNVRLQVEGFVFARTDPTCPLFVRCAPNFPFTCVAGGEIVLNGTAPGNCELAVEPRTWTGVKALFR